MLKLLALLPVMLMVCPVARAATDCDIPRDMGRTVMKVSDTKGRALIEITRPEGAGRKVTVDYGQDSFVTSFDAKGVARLAIAMTEPENTLEIRMMETPPITCTVKVEDFKKLYRAILVWTDPVRLDLDVLEPGRGPGGPGHINRVRPNSDGSQGIGELDVSIAGTEDGGSGQSSYVVADVSKLPRDGMMVLRAEYTSRGAQPQAPFCGNHPKAVIRFDLLILEGGRVSKRAYTTSRASCGEPMPDTMRVARLRQ